MIATIIKREFLDNILSFKFAACVLVAIVISLASTAILTRDYQERLRNYDKGVAAANEALTKVPVYSSLKVRLFRKPTPLSIFAAGIERKAGNFAEISLLYQDIPASLQGGVAKNEFAGVFSRRDHHCLYSPGYSTVLRCNLGRKRRGDALPGPIQFGTPR
jgi:hypothetical protein